MQKFLNFLKKLLGKKVTKRVRPLGHGIKSWLSAAYFGFPGKKITLIGITGTKGKTTTTILTGRLMNLAGVKTGYISTGTINTSGEISKEFLNPYKMTTLDGFVLQKYLSEIVKNGCNYAVLEMSSLGLEQNRHWGMGKFDVTMLTNLYPEHLEAHGGIENYKNAKGILFQNLKEGGLFIGNYEKKQDELSEFMWNKVPENIRSYCKKIEIVPEKSFKIIDEENTLYKTLIYNDKKYFTDFIAGFDLQNLFFAIQTVESFKPQFSSELQNILSKLRSQIPGRMEFVVKDGQIVFNKSLVLASGSQSPISILVDYAHEPESLQKLMETLLEWKTKKYFDKIIHILSSDGAGRDDWKKPVMGSISYRYADFSIITTDNYDMEDKPQEILDLLTKDLPVEKMVTKDLLLENLSSKKFLKQTNRKKAFEMGLTLAKIIFGTKDTPETLSDEKKRILIVSTGVGSEQGLTQPEGKLEWDERDVWIEEYNKFAA